MKVEKGSGNFFTLRVPATRRDQVASLMAYRGSWLWERNVLGWVGPIKLRTVESFGKTRDEVFSDLRKTEHGSFVADQPTQEYDL